MQRLWFKAKNYGWGWTPATWQGWLVTLGYIASVATSAFIFLRPKSAAVSWIGYGASIVVLTAILIAVCYKTGERPRWQWGEQDARK